MISARAAFSRASRVASSTNASSRICGCSGIVAGAVLPQMLQQARRVRPVLAEPLLLLVEARAIGGDQIAEIHEPPHVALVRHRKPQHAQCGSIWPRGIVIRAKAAFARRVMIP